MRGGGLVRRGIWFPVRRGLRVLRGRRSRGLWFPYKMVVWVFYRVPRQVEAYTSLASIWGGPLACLGSS